MTGAGLVAQANPGLAVLTWDAPEGDADAVDGYEILRRRTNRGEKVLLTLVADTGTADTTYVDRSANEEGVKYAYRVKALRNGTASNSSPFTNAIGLPAATLEYVVTEDEHKISEQESCPNLEDDTDVVQICHLPDVNLRTGIEQTLGKSPGDGITLGGMEALTSLDLSYSQLTSIDITGLEHALNLTGLNLDGNQLTQITGLGKLTSLTELAIYKNKLETIDVTGLPNLVSLDLRYNKLTSISGLADLASLTSLLLRSNKLASIDVTGLTSLEALTVFHNQLTSIVGLSDLTSLTTLDLSYNYLASVSLTGLTSLTDVALAHNLLTSIDLTGLTSLADLNLSVNKLTSIDLTGLTKLRVRNLCCNGFAQVSGLEDLTDLRVLKLGSNDLSSFDASDLTELESLYLENNNLSFVNVSGLGNLIRLGLRNNDLTMIDVSDLTELDYLELRENPLTESDIVGLRADTFLAM